MTSRNLVLVVFGLTLTTSCSSNPADARPGDPHGPCDPVGGPATDQAAFGGIDYQVIGGFTGDGDGTSVHIRPDGSVTRQTVKRGLEQGKLDQATLDDVIAKARAARFPELCTMYACEHCGDDFVFQVAVQFDGNVLTARASEFGDPPDRMQALIDALKAIVDRPL